MQTTTLFRPVGAAELELIRESGFVRFPPRLPEQPIFYPVLNEAYAIEIARGWNTQESTGVGYVTRFEVRSAFLEKYQVQRAGGRTHLEYWIPAGDLADFNANIVGYLTSEAERNPTNSDHGRKIKAAS
jgi:hypothetical protein